ncbi:MAG: cysteine desulfurase family protein [Candidatus Pacebacteria bacterium]|nr:cysteine desulfurase family protein [Candidatus Paceibacterota bacterium]
MQKIYLDNAATTKIDKKVFEAMAPYLKGDFGNASSLHWFGQKAHEAITKARQQAADFLNCNFLEVYFTGSATESDNLAIFGAMRAAQKKGIAKPHIITSAIEHPAVLEVVKHLEKTGEIEATYLAVGKEGVVKVEDVQKSIKENTVLVSIMYVNNEIGAIQPIAAIGNWLKIKNQKSKIKILLHTDAVQAVNYLDCNVGKLGVDLLTLSGHKIYGPKGAGVLYKRKGVELEPIIFGGHQERGLRPGTENIAAIVGVGEAIAEILNSKLQILKIKKLRDKLIDGILKNIPGTNLNGSRESRLPNNVNISFDGVEGESILMALNEKGVAVSTGSACASGSLEPSYVLLALGCSVVKAHGSIRFTLGKYNTEKDINYVLKILPGIIERLRKISPLK